MTAWWYGRLILCIAFCACKPKTTPVATVSAVDDCAQAQASMEVPSNVTNSLEFIEATNPEPIGEMVPMFAETETFGEPNAFALYGDCPPSPLSAVEEEQLIRDAYAYATDKVKTEHPGLGRGWVGNMTGCGPKCDVVHDSYQPHLKNYLDQRLQGRKLQHYTPVTVFDSGWAPFDAAAHVYMGIGTVPKKFGEQPQLKSWTDPWRYGDSTQYKPGTGPNNEEQVIPSY